MSDDTMTESDAQELIRGAQYQLGQFLANALTGKSLPVAQPARDPLPSQRVVTTERDDYNRITLTDGHGNRWRFAYRVMHRGSKAVGDTPARNPEVMVLHAGLVYGLDVDLIQPVTLSAISPQFLDLLHSAALDAAIDDLEDAS